MIKSFKDRTNNWNNQKRNRKIPKYQIEIRNINKYQIKNNFNGF